MSGLLPRKFPKILKIAINSIAATITAPTMMVVASKMLNSSLAGMSCHVEIPHKQRAAIAIPAMVAAVFLRTFSSEKIKVGPVIYVAKARFTTRVIRTSPE